MLDGHCDPAFRAVREMFADGFAAGRELGAALAVYADGRLVADLWGGLADRRSGRPWEAGTPCLAFSTTKAVTATAALLLAERGGYEIDGPVTGWWPEFGRHGKDAATAAHLLSHQAGLPAFARTVPAEEAADPAAMAAELAGQPPEWTPGEAHGYHALTFGWLAGEIVRRHSGRTVGRFVRDEIAGDLDLWIGAPPDVRARAARLAAAPREPGNTGNVLEYRAFASPDPGKGGFNNPVVVEAGWPAAGMVTTARALATFYRDLIAGRILRPGTLREAVRPRVSGPDRVLKAHSSFGLGFLRSSPSFPALSGAFGHPGSGGSLGLADPDAGIAFAYVPNLLGPGIGDQRARRLVEALYTALR